MPLLRFHPLLRPLFRLRSRQRYHAEIVQWKNNGRPAPPPHWIKQQRIRSYQRAFGLRILVETGTFQGEMVEAMLGTFRKIYSIELSDEFSRKARERFRQLEEVEIIHGDSATELGSLMPRLDRPTLFWLDGHYSGADTAKGIHETPILAELEHIVAAPDHGHVVLIDDARLFGTDPSYPAIAQIEEFAAKHRPAWTVSVENDCICLAPRSSLLSRKA